MKLFRSILIAAAVSLLLPAAAIAQGVDCTQTVQYDASTNGATKLVTGAAATRVFICGYQIVSGGTVNISLVTGTGTNCGTSQAALTPAFNMVANGRIDDSSPYWRGLVAQPGLDFCIKTSAGIAVQALIFFVQR